MAQQENAPNKPVHLMYLVGAVILFYLLQWSIDWVWGAVSTSPSDFKISLLAAVGATVTSIVLYKNDRIFTLANEVSSELAKVTWPTAKEVRQSTFTVIAMAIISALILGFFDFIWSNLTELVYG
ncbi:MAG TPA: preprotein translocase subunit SecE [Kofleriaceae bacterium]|nr:preprotein translocase subunit SecE [Kofleriaceae bacterium]